MALRAKLRVRSSISVGGTQRLKGAHQKTALDRREIGGAQPVGERQADRAQRRAVKAFEVVLLDQLLLLVGRVNAARPGAQGVRAGARLDVLEGEPRCAGDGR